jgi:hypothetical protein
MRFAVKSIRSLPIMCSVDQKSEPMQMAGDMTGTLAKGSLDVVRKKRPFKLASINIRLPIRSAGGGPAARHIIHRNYFWRQPGDTAVRIMASEDKLQSNSVQLSEHSFLDPSPLHQGRNNRSTCELEFLAHGRECDLCTRTSFQGADDSWTSIPFSLGFQTKCSAKIASPAGTEFCQRTSFIDSGTGSAR